MIYLFVGSETENAQCGCFPGYRLSQNELHCELTPTDPVPQAYGEEYVSVVRSNLYMYRSHVMKFMTVKISPHENIL